MWDGTCSGRPCCYLEFNARPAVTQSGISVQEEWHVQVQIFLSFVIIKYSIMLSVYKVQNFVHHVQGETKSCFAISINQFH